MGVHNLAMENNHSISLYPGTGSADGTTGDHVLICPNYRSTSHEILEIVDRVTRVVQDFFDSI